MDQEPTHQSEIAAWQRRIEEVFAGPAGIVGERLLDLGQLERKRTQQLLRSFAGYVRVMDAFLDFYVESLSVVWHVDRTEWSSQARFLYALNTVNLWRWRGAYQIFWSGYNAEALALLRTNMEIALLLAALGARLVPWSHVFGGSPVPPDADSPSKLHRHYERERRKLERLIEQRLIGEGSGLAMETQEALRTWRRVLHGEVHRSTNELLSQFTAFARGQPTILFPSYDEDRASLFTNSSIFLAFLTVRTLPLLQVAPREMGTTWCSRYQVLDESLSFAVRGFPKYLGRAIEELAAVHFTFGGSDGHMNSSA